ncbi:MAG: Ig-like domain-containing protein [Treponema sp.]|nr:Ig-like domain-containing protein [Treponema sp.]
MKKKCLFFAALSILFIYFLSGCASFLYSVSIRTEGNITSVLAGRSLNMRATGRSIVWSISSTSDGSGTLASGTSISPNGVLTVAPNETALIIYVTAASAQDNFSATQQIRIVTVTNVNVSPVNQAVAIGRTFQFRAQVTGTNQPDNAVTWSVSSNAAGTGAVTQGTSINSSGLLTVAPNEQLITLFVTATSLVDPAKSGTVLATVVVPTVTSVTVTPANQSLTAGASLQFNASVIGLYDPVNTVTWRVSSNAAGTGAVTPGTAINANGLLTVASNETLTTLFITATSAADTSKSGTVTVSVIVPAVTGVTVIPSNQTMTAGGSFQFAASVAGVNNPNTAVTWRVSSNAAGTGTVASGTSINTNGLLTVSDSETARTLFVFAVSVFDVTKSGSVAITVTPAPAAPPTAPIVTTPAPSTPATPAPVPPAVTTPTPAPSTIISVIVNPATRTTQTNSTVQFNATVTGANNPNTTVTWRVSSNAAGTGAVAPATTIDVNGLLRVAPNEWSPVLYVFAISAADPSKSGSATVTVSNNNANQGANQGVGN